MSSQTWVTEWLKSSTKGRVVPDTVWEGLACCVCWQGASTTKSKDHGALRCPLLASFNKVRKNARLAPVDITSKGLSAGLQKAPVGVETVEKDVRKVEKELKGIISALEKRLVLVEKQAGLKRKAEDSQSSAPPEKKRKKSGKGKAKGTEEEQSGGQQSVRAKGKGKGKKKKHGPSTSSHNTNVPSAVASWEDD